MLSCRPAGGSWYHEADP